MQLVGDGSELAFTQSEVLFTMRKHEWLAVCNAVCWTVGQDAKWEVQLYIGTPENAVVSVQSDSRTAARHVADKWKRQMKEKGWREADEFQS